MQLLPCAKDVCPACAVAHDPRAIHNAQSLYYQYFFYARHGRWPTWADAIAHCAEPVRVLARKTLTRHNAWSEPAEGEPIPIRAGVVDGVGVELTDQPPEAEPC